MSDRNIRVRLLTGSLGRVEDGAPVVYKPGTEFLVNATEIETHGERLVVVNAPPVQPPSAVAELEAIADQSEEILGASDIKAETEAPADHWRAAKTQVSALESVDEVRAFLAAEEAGKARDSVIEAAEARIVELGG